MKNKYNLGSSKDKFDTLYLEVKDNIDDALRLIKNININGIQFTKVISEEDSLSPLDALEQIREKYKDDDALQKRLKIIEIELKRKDEDFDFLKKTYELTTRKN